MYVTDGLESGFAGVEYLGGHGHGYQSNLVKMQLGTVPVDQLPWRGGLRLHALRIGYVQIDLAPFCSHVCNLQMLCRGATLAVGGWMQPWEWSL